jgi:endonuclease/exonuclease/phosphatase family metal-dependent hydrolase
MIQVNILSGQNFAANSSSVKAATYNIHGFRHMSNNVSVNYIANYISGENISIFCMQEFSSHSLFNMREVAGAFDFFPFSTLTDNSAPKAGLVIFSRFPIKAKGMLKIESLSNGVLWADVELPDGRILRVINAHLQTTGISRSYYHGFRRNIKVIGDNFKLRARQANILNAFIDSSKTPVILCGDFNDTPSSYTYKKAKGNLVDGFKEAGSGLGSTFKHKSSMLRIDYIMYSKQLKGVRYYSVYQKWSDHNPVIAELEYQN